jgi:uncharacterized protein involved in high-affinity Fe2+ transport
MNKFVILGLMVLSCNSAALAFEMPLCALPIGNSKAIVDNAKVEGDPDPGCAQVYANAVAMAKASKSNIIMTNTMPIPPQLSVGTVYLQPITMAPAGMMAPRDKSDIHLEIDIHAKTNLKSRGFAPGLVTDKGLSTANFLYSICYFCIR